MTIQDIAAREQVSLRQAQRYCCAPGYQGHVLKATKVGKAFHIEESDYTAWRVLCGWETAQPVVVQPQVPAPSTPDVERTAPGDVRPASVTSLVTHPAPPTYPPYPLPADPVNGVLTNAPHPRSCNHPHPLACEAYMRQEAAKLLTKYRGDTPDEYDYED